jgi:hypothetical protein
MVSSTSLLGYLLGNRPRHHWIVGRVSCERAYTPWERDKSLLLSDNRTLVVLHSEQSLFQLGYYSTSSNALTLSLREPGLPLLPYNSVNRNGGRITLVV